ncbi:MAG: hypothetical protein JJ934_18030 [Pseudomonadales bacterium]|nr:hypothetical protein [Pseudomonadales bacterium]
MSDYLNQIVKVLLLLAFAAVMVVVPYQQWFGPPMENHENRKLAELPALPENKKDLWKFPKAFSNYMDDNFGFRSDLLRSYHRVMVESGTSPSQKVVLGKSGWLFFTNQNLTDQNRGAMPLSDERLEKYLKGFRSQREWVEGLGAHYVLLPTPDKNTMYPEFLPDWVKQVGPSRYDQVFEYLRNNNEPFVDVEPNLWAARDSGENLYRQTDTHWNCLGGFRAYEALMTMVETFDLPNVTRLTEDDIEFTNLPEKNGGDMARNVLLLDDILLEPFEVKCEVKNPEPVKGIRIKDGYVAKLPLVPKGQGERWRYIKQSHAPKTRVLMYRDSYSYAMLQYLILSFDELIVVSRPDLKFDNSAVREFKPDLVIYQFVERSLYWRPTFKPDDSASSG